MIYTRRSVYFLSMVITVFLFGSYLLLEMTIKNFIPNLDFISNIAKSSQEKIPQEKEKNIQEQKPEESKSADLTQMIQMAKQSSNMWELYVPDISLVAPIEEGTDKEIMDRSIGHFRSTSVLDGNIGLAAHNRGYPVNYFQHLKSLEKGDPIVYKSVEEIRIYQIETITVIKDTDWTYLKPTQDNRITLITCVENEPEYRRCIQAVEQK